MTTTGTTVCPQCGFDWNLPDDGYRRPGARSWDEVTTDLKPLLDHSDCDGEMTPEECAQVFPRLREIAAAWPKHGVAMSDAFDRKSALALAECMEVCAAGGEQLLFR